jgi:hypothetical protein
MRNAFVGVRFYTNRGSLPVPDCWCGDDISGDSGTVSAVLPGSSASQLYKRDVPVAHRKGFYTTVATALHSEMLYHRDVISECKNLILSVHKI